MVATILPLAGIGDSLFLINNLSARDACVFSAMLNSFVFDYIARQKATGGNLSFYVLKQLPVVPPSAFDEVTRAFVVNRTLELVVTAADLLPFGVECGYVGAPFRWDSGRRLVLRAELDAVFLRLFGISRGDAEYLLDFFEVVRRRDESEAGEYRTKRIILEIYDAMAEATRTGKPYQTRLDPPPADSRVAHSARPGGVEYESPALATFRDVESSMLPAEIRLGDAVWRVSPWPHDRPPHEGEQVVVRQQVGTNVVAGLGKARVASQRDARSGAPLIKLVVTGAGANVELSFTESEWARFRPFGLAERV